MSFTPNFSVTQSSTDYAEVTATDTSTGSDGAITQRRIYFIQANGAYLTTSATTHDYFQWAYASATKTIADLLDKDYALNIKVEWLDVSNVVLYTKTILYGFDAYENDFLYQLSCAQTSNPSLINNQNYWLNKMILRCQVDDASQSITQGNDIYSAQAAYNRGMYLVNNPQTFF
jgi:hypothetical protein